MSVTAFLSADNDTFKLTTLISCFLNLNLKTNKRKTFIGTKTNFAL